VTALLHIEALRPSDELEDFDCGEPAQNLWLKSRAIQNQKNDDTRAYIGWLDGNIAGFFALGTSSVARGILPGSLRRNAPDPVGCVLLAQLGVAVAYQGRGLSGQLILHAMEQAERVAQIVGCRLFMVHPARSELVGYYRRFGFTEIFTNADLVMAMTMQNVRKALEAIGA